MGERSNTGLALVLLLDQFTRQVYRGRPQAFSGDAQALELSKRAWPTVGSPLNRSERGGSFG